MFSSLKVDSKQKAETPINKLMEELAELIRVSKLEEALDKANEILTRVSEDGYTVRELDRISKVIATQTTIISMLKTLGAPLADQEKSSFVAGIPMYTRFKNMDNLVKENRLAAALLACSEALVQLATDPNYKEEEFYRYNLLATAKIQIMDVKATLVGIALEQSKEQSFYKRLTS